MLAATMLAIEGCQGDVDDPVELRSQDKNAKDHQARDHDIGSSPHEKGLVDSEAGDLASLDVGSEVGTVEAEQVDVRKDKQHRRPERGNLTRTFTGDGSRCVPPAPMGVLSTPLIS